MPPMGKRPLPGAKNKTVYSLSKKSNVATNIVLTSAESENPIIIPATKKPSVIDNIHDIMIQPTSSRQTSPTPQNKDDYSSIFRNTQDNPSTPHPASAPIPTSNRFTPLQTSTMETDDVAQKAGPAQAQIQPHQNLPRLRAPAPVIIAGKISDHQALINCIKKQSNNGFHIKYTRNNANVFFENKTDKDKFVNLIKEKQWQFHTYTDSDDKSHAFVLRGLDSEPTTDELLCELKNHHKINASKIFKMTTQHRPLYLVITSSQVTLNNLQQNCRNIFYTRVTWERHINKKVLTQCHRCQSWGHATTNCYRNPKCLKCAGDHLTITCTKPKDTPAKCANCAEAHPANSTQCNVYLRKLDEAAASNPRLAEKLRYESVATKPTPQFIPAPIPKFNIWQQKQLQQQQMPGQREFPPLPSRHQQQQHQRFQPQQKLPQQPLMGANPYCPPPPQQSASAPTPTDTTAPPANIGQTKNIIFELTNEIKNLNSLLNMNNLLKFVRDLNVELRKCNDQHSRAFIAIEFMSNISSYNI